ncbi:MAG: hypothetical protein N4A72_17250 [Bacteroidales bacterium]|jgi:hypothetical protein|nr:hypothetical protein [Bacteroidales bacterium]
MRNLKEKSIKLNCEEMENVSGGKIDLPIYGPIEHMRCYNTGFKPVMKCSACKFVFVCDNPNAM